jgi:hypothetical protein
MKKIFLLFSVGVLGFFFFTAQQSPENNKNSGMPEAPPIHNSAKLIKWYQDHGYSYPENPVMMRGPVTLPNIMYQDNPDVPVLPSSNPQTENSIAVSTLNAQKLMVSTNTTPTSTGQGYYFSSNGGLNWTGTDFSPNGISNYGDPVAMFDLNGNAYWVTLASPGGITMARTSNSGTTWTTLTGADNTNSANDDKEHACVDLSGVYPNNVYVAWTDFTTSPAGVFVNRSTNNGTTWGVKTAITGLGSDLGQGVNMSTAPNGDVYLIMANYAGGSLPESGIRFLKSTNGGATWPVSTVAFPISGIRTSNGAIAAFGNTRATSFPSMGVDRSGGSRNGWIYIAYNDKTSDVSDVLLRRSTDGGTSWSTPFRVNQEPVGDGKPQWASSVAVDATNGSVNVSYYDMDSTALLTARYIATSLDGGVTWQYTKASDVRFTPQQLGGSFASGYMGDYYETAAGGGKVWACWSDNRTGTFNAFVSSITLGPSISHTPLGNTEQITGSRTVAAQVLTANSGLMAGQTKLLYSKNNPVITDSIVMTNSGGNNWSANLPLSGAGTYRYYIKTLDSLGRAATSPPGAPATLHTFTAQTDVTVPVIVHTPLTNVAKPSWPATVSATVTDNIGIDSSWVKWYKNSTANTKQFKLINTSGSNYSAAFNSLNSDVAVGDSIFYRIYAQDNSAGHNRDSTALYKFKIINVFLCEGFTDAAFPPANWSITATGTVYWTRNTVSSYGIGTGSAKFDFWSAASGTTQSLNSLTFGNTIANDTLRFDEAYAPYTSGTDSLILYSSTNAGSTFTRFATFWGNAAGGPLNTAPTATSAFTPTSTQWATKKCALPVGTNQVRFTSYSGFGNNLYVDSICVKSTVSGVQNIFTGIPNVYKLDQNYPNPFNPVTKINFAMPKQGLVTLKVYDMVGREVATLINEVRNAGYYSADFNGMNFASGVYFYKLVANDFIDTKRMVLIK